MSALLQEYDNYSRLTVAANMTPLSYFDWVGKNAQLSFDFAAGSTNSDEDIDELRRNSARWKLVKQQVHYDLSLDANGQRVYTIYLSTRNRFLLDRDTFRDDVDAAIAEKAKLTQP